jgi:2-oxoglutarate dehydrogenase E2 component (dihydrolipoamide succinyltransferase)
MPTKIVVPDLGESVIEATVAEWLKKEGDPVAVGETVVTLDTDKVTLEVAATSEGTLAAIEKPAGADVKVGELLGLIGEAGANGGAPETPPATGQPASQANQEAEPAAKERVTPVARRMAEEHAVDLAQVTPGGSRVTKEDVQRYLEGKDAPAQAEPPRAEPAKAAPAPAPSPAPAAGGRDERRPMSRRRQTIARRLIEAQQTAAMLTTFNEVDMHAVMALRARRKDSFKTKHGVSLGLSSFFVKAVIGALKAFPLLNAEIQGNEIVFKHYYDIGIAIGAEDGLVVPVLREADRMSFAQIEHAVRDYAKQAEEGKLAIESLRGGTFTITNGGIFGSMLSTPILNPPQTGILGLHAIKDRPVVVDGAIVVRPIMYVALTYDHRLIDGREAVQFLVRIKELIEDPETLLLEG